MNLRMKYNTKMKKKSLPKPKAYVTKNMDKYLGLPSLIS